MNDDQKKHDELINEVEELRQLKSNQEPHSDKNEHIESALKESEKKFRMLFNSVFDAIVIHENRIIIDVNQKFVELFGYELSELIGMNVLNLAAPESRELIKNNIISDNEEPYEAIGKRKDGTTITGRICGKLIPFQGRWVRITAIREETKHKHTEEALRDGEERYRSLFEGMPIGLYRTTPDGKVREVNPALVTMLGYPDKEAIYALNTVDLYVEADDRERWLQSMAQDGVRKSFETRLYRADGSVIWVRENTRAVKDSKSGLSFYEGSLEDITERKLAEEALLEGEARYRNLIETVPDGITLIDLEGNIMMVNMGSATLFGFENTEDMMANARNAFNFIAPEDRQRAMESMSGTLKEGYLKDAEYALIKNDGTRFPGELTVSVVPDAKGNPKAFVAIIRDISERKHAEEIIQESRERYRSLFENSPISLWEEDFSEIKSYIEHLRETGVLDFRKYFEEHPEEVLACTNMIRVVDVNNATIDLYKAASKDEFFHGMERFFTKETFDAFREELIVIAEGKTRFEIETINQTLAGRRKHIAMTWSVAPGFEKTLSKMFVSIIDITERKRAEEELKRSFEMLQKTLEGTVQALAVTSEKRDPYTAGHQQRVTKLATAIARELKLSNEQIEAIRLAGFLHDIGKISIPAEILIKPGPLAEFEMGIIRSHALIGYEILQAVPFVQPIAKIVLQHHEKINGSGYPYGLTGDQMLLEAKIIVVADVVEAMASHRPYRPAHGIEKALQEVAQFAGVLYEPIVVEACLKLFTQKAFSFL